MQGEVLPDPELHKSTTLHEYTCTGSSTWPAVHVHHQGRRYVQCSCSARSAHSAAASSGRSVVVVLSSRLSCCLGVSHSLFRVHQCFPSPSGPRPDFLQQLQPPEPQTAPSVFRTYPKSPALEVTVWAMDGTTSSSCGSCSTYWARALHQMSSSKV